MALDIVIVGVFGIVLIIRMGLRHHEKMMMVEQGRTPSNIPNQGLAHEVQALRQEVSSLRERVNDLALNVDDHKLLAQRLGATDDVTHSG